MVSRKNARVRRFLTARFRDVLHLCSGVPGAGATARASAGIIKNTSDSGKIKHALMIYLIFMKCAALVPRDRARRTDRADDITAPLLSPPGGTGADGISSNQKSSMLIRRETTGPLMFKDGIAKEKPPKMENPTWPSEQRWIKPEFQH